MDSQMRYSHTTEGYAAKGKINSIVYDDMDESPRCYAERREASPCQVIPFVGNSKIGRSNG